MSMMVSFVLSFFPRDVLDEILKLIGSVSEDFPSYSSIMVKSSIPHSQFGLNTNLQAVALTGTLSKKINNLFHLFTTR